LRPPISTGNADAAGNADDAGNADAAGKSDDAGKSDGADGSDMVKISSTGNEVILVDIDMLLQCCTH